MNLGDELKKITSQVTGIVTDQAKDSAISTLNDPEFRQAINGFTKQWIEENKVILITVVGSFLLLSVMAISNIISNYGKR